MKSTTIFIHLLSLTLSGVVVNCAEIGVVNITNISSSYCQLHHKDEDKGNTNSSKIVCIPKCCPEDQVLDFGGQLSDVMGGPKCADSGGQEWSAFINIQDEHNSTEFVVFHKDLKCSSKQSRVEFVHYSGVSHLPEDHEAWSMIQQSEFEFFPNGTLFYTFYDWENLVSLKEEDFCLDGIQNYGSGTVPEKYSGNYGHQGLIVCHDNAHEEEVLEADLHTLIYYIILPFATMFLIVTILVYILVWKTLNIHGYTLFSYVCSLCGNNCILFISQLNTVPHDTQLCAFIGVWTHFFFLLTTCWLTTINFDVWHTFKDLKAGRPTKNLKKYLQYCTFAFGAPLLIVLISGVLDSTYRHDPNPPIFLPQYRTFCILSQESVAYYLYIPFGFLICCNFFFFFWTIRLLISYQKSIKAVLKGTCTEKEDQSVSLFLKLFVVMGFSWSFEVIGWAIKKYSGGENEREISIGVAVVDIFNILLAIPIFFIFVWKRQFFDHLWEKPYFRGPLSLLILCGCVNNSRGDKRPSFSAMTMSTLNRSRSTLKSKRGSNGDVEGNKGPNQGKRISSGSVSEMIKNRKKSEDSQHGLEKKISTASADREIGMAVLVEEISEHENPNEDEKAVEKVETVQV